MQTQDPRTISEFVTLIAGLAEAFRQEASEPLLAAYELGLSDLELPAIRRAVQRALRECRFMPSVRELRDLSGDMPAESRATLAWSSLRGAIGSVGGYRSVDFDDPVINAAVRELGGWVLLCEKPSEELERFIRPRFEKVYAILFSHGVTGETAAPCLGLIAKENGARGLTHSSSAPVRIETGLPPTRLAIRNRGEVSKAAIALANSIGNGEV